MDFSTDQLILLKQYCLALSCIDCKKSSIFFFQYCSNTTFWFLFLQKLFSTTVFFKKLF